MDRISVENKLAAMISACLTGDAYRVGEIEREILAYVEQLERREEELSYHIRELLRTSGRVRND